MVKTKEEKKETTVSKKSPIIKKPKKGSNWENMKDMILLHPKESRAKYFFNVTYLLRYQKKRNPQKSVSETNQAKLEELLNPDGKGTTLNTPIIAIDCEMVGIGKGNESALGRVSIVNSYGAVR